MSRRSRRPVRHWSEPVFQIAVISSLVANLLLGLLSGARRRSASGWLSILQRTVVSIMWLAYQIAEVSTTSALGKLSLSGFDTSADEQQLVAFWAPFLLLHLGGPDNLTAYALEDNKLSMRKGAEIIVWILGVVQVIFTYNYPYGSDYSWALFVASAIVFLEGAASCLERAYTLQRASLDMKKKKKKTTTTTTTTKKKMKKTTDLPADSRCAGSTTSSCLDDGEALLRAQDLFPVWRRALSDSSVGLGSRRQRAREEIFSLGWRSMCAVVEMELSLMYDFLYTKAIVAHTFPAGYYLIRFISPIIATPAAAWLFWLWLHDHDRIIRASFLAITYLLLATTFALDVVWLLRALGSTWAYAFLKARPPRDWLRRQLLCTGRWRRLHHAVVSLDPLRLFGCDPISYRRWSGTIGRYNLLRECTTTEYHHRCSCCHLFPTKAVPSKDIRYLSELPHDVRKLLFERVRLILPTANNPPPSPEVDTYSMAAIKRKWGNEALKKGKKLFQGTPDDELPKFGRDFQEDVVAWHIATCIFLSRATVRKLTKPSTHVAAIEAMSEYLMFLVAERQQMLPGLVLNKLLKRTRRALVKEWNEGKGCVTVGTREMQLATILRQARIKNQEWAKDDKDGQLLSDAVEIFGALTKSSVCRQKVPPMLELIFNVWVDKLLYASVRCSREIHVQQLSRGGELTTILWLIVQHAGPFRIGEKKPDPKRTPNEKKPEEPAPMCPPICQEVHPICHRGSWPPICHRCGGWFSPHAMHMPEHVKDEEHEKHVPFKEEVHEGAKEHETLIQDDEDREMLTKESKMKTKYATLY